MVTNLQLNLYTISASDNSGSDTDSSTSVSSSSESDDEEVDIKPALGNYWSEILDLRVIVSMDANIQESDILGFVEIKRKLTVLESSKMLPLKNVLVNITDTGIN
jgi:hypothetical protein